MFETDDEWLNPGPEVTRKLFKEWQSARRGTRQAEEMTNPVWKWLFQGRINPYRANEYFRSRLARLLNQQDFPSGPRWSGERFGQSRTCLSDGRTVWIAGEHEDYYDPDFFIYNDVIIEHPEGRLQILGYSEAAFRPTDFHTATTLLDETCILLIGNTGYADHRRPGTTQIYRLDLQDYWMVETNSFGNGPGWIGSHTAELSTDGQQIIVRGGRCQTEKDYIDNIDDWSLDLRDFVWTRLTDRRWPQFFVSRSDKALLHLWEYSTHEMHLPKLQIPGLQIDDLATQLGMEPRMDIYKSLFVPMLPHRPVKLDPCSSDDDADWSATIVIIDEVKVRFVDERKRVKIIVEGQLPEIKLESLISEFTEKLALVENADCEFERTR